MSIFTCTVHHKTVVFFTDLNGGNGLGSMFISFFLSTSYVDFNLVLI